jgi:hypothetical protein
MFHRSAHAGNPSAGCQRHPTFAQAFDPADGFSATDVDFSVGKTATGKDRKTPLLNAGSMEFAPNRVLDTGPVGRLEATMRSYNSGASQVRTNTKSLRGHSLQEGT